VAKPVINETSDEASEGGTRLAVLKDYDRIEAQFNVIQTSRLQALLVSFATGAVSLVLVFTVVRACNRVVARKASGAVVRPSGAAQGLDAEEEQLYCE
jgi:hypothetical protein